MDFRPLVLKDKKIFDAAFKRHSHALAAYSFENIYIWRSLFALSWADVRGLVCLFFKNNAGCFMNFPPLGGFDPDVVMSCFEVMESLNKNKEVSRIENVEEENLAVFKKRGFRSYEKNREYIVASRAIAFLSGEQFKHQRNLYNFFVKHNEALFRNYEAKDQKDVLELCESWSRERRLKNTDPIYRAMLEDSFKALSVLMKDFKKLGCRAKVVVCGGKIRAFTSGFEISPELFCVNFEIADLAIKGLAQFTFSEFAKTLSQYREINMMDDSGIENIRRTKLLFRPTRLVPSHTVLLKNL